MIKGFIGARFTKGLGVAEVLLTKGPVAIVDIKVVFVVEFLVAPFLAESEGFAKRRTFFCSDKNDRAFDRMTVE